MEQSAMDTDEMPVVQPLPKAISSYGHLAYRVQPFLRVSLQYLSLIVIFGVAQVCRAEDLLEARHLRISSLLYLVTFGDYCTSHGKARRVGICTFES